MINLHIGINLGLGLRFKLVEELVLSVPSVLKQGWVLWAEISGGCLFII